MGDEKPEVGYCGSVGMTWWDLRGDGGMPVVFLGSGTPFSFGEFEIWPAPREEAKPEPPAPIQPLTAKEKAELKIAMDIFLKKKKARE